ncbi:hypothetical protein N574_0117505 [Lactiplantibacillus plantarum 2165]|nr:hypothetical protein N574_0117505 [Lactiplantibacillus plantarum 2165]
MSKVVIKGELPSLNEYIKLNGPTDTPQLVSRSDIQPCAAYMRGQVGIPELNSVGLASLNLRGTRRTTGKMRIISRLLKSLCWTAL